MDKITTHKFKPHKKCTQTTPSSTKISKKDKKKNETNSTEIKRTKGSKTTYYYKQKFVRGTTTTIHKSEISSSRQTVLICLTKSRSKTLLALPPPICK